MVRNSFCLMLIAGLVPGAAAAQVPAGERAAAADRAVSAHAQSDEPGVVAAVVRDGVVVYRTAVGLASLEQGTPLSTATILDIGSVAKQVTGFAIVLLEAQGRLSLEDDIRRHLPELPDLGQPITIRNLLNHTGGLREIYNTMMIGGWQNGDAMTQEQALRIAAVQPALQFAPGSEHLYNNTGYMLLADIVERVTGTEFHDWMRENVFAPLGMSNTVIMHRLGQVIPGSADSYAPVDGGGYVRVFDNSTVQGAGGIYSTAEDMALWLRHWSRPAVGSPQLLERMQERTVLTGGDTLAYALGVNVGRHRGLRRLQHTGSSAGYRSALIAYPELGGGVVVQSNNASVNASRVAQELGDIFFGDRMAPLPPAVADGAEAADEPAHSWAPGATALAAYTGRFYSAEVESLYEVAVEADTLVVRHRRIGVVPLQPRSPDVFAARAVIGEVRFERDAAGRITGFKVANGRTRGVLFMRMP